MTANDPPMRIPPGREYDLEHVERVKLTLTVTRGGAGAGAVDTAPGPGMELPVTLRVTHIRMNNGPAVPIPDYIELRAEAPRLAGS
jgi:hypothetical protein